MNQAELEQKYPFLKDYIQKHQNNIQKIIAQGQEQNNTKSKFPKKLGGKDDEPL